MLYEKPQVKIKPNINIIGYSVLLIAATALITYGACLIYGVAIGYNKNASIGPLDLISGISNSATAAAFFLALFQYKKNTLQQRQSIISAEVIAQIEEAKKIISEIKTGNESSLVQINKSTILLSNLGTNIRELFDSMEEDVYKAIVRMHWQDMHFNHVCHTFTEINGLIAIRNEIQISDNDFLIAVHEAKVRAEQKKPLPTFKDYVFLQELLGHPNIKERISLKEKLKALDLFCHYYLNDKEANDFLYGIISRIDVREAAPLLAAAGPNSLAISS